ncbi:hypothetical protein C8Q80DRAFT_1275793 [Daedaleopsis nitida]|nr:hypothetical protein C8Q80DRAFT_1275793 [Daedaleopsis nitida]
MDLTTISCTSIAKRLEEMNDYHAHPNIHILARAGVATGGFGCFAIAFPAVLPAHRLFNLVNRQARSQGLLPKREASGRTTRESVEYYYFVELRSTLAQAGYVGSIYSPRLMRLGVRHGAPPARPPSTCVRYTNRCNWLAMLA